MRPCKFHGCFIPPLQMGRRSAKIALRKVRARPGRMRPCHAAATINGYAIGAHPHSAAPLCPMHHVSARTPRRRSTFDPSSSALDPPMAQGKADAKKAKVYGKIGKKIIQM